jgi:hypothetical protein
MVDGDRYGFGLPFRYEDDGAAHGVKVKDNNCRRKKAGNENQGPSRKYKSRGKI